MGKPAKRIDVHHHVVPPAYAGRQYNAVDLPRDLREAIDHRNAEALFPRVAA